MTIARRLWFGFGTLLVLFAVVVVCITLWLRELDQNLRQMTTVAMPLADAAHGMDIKALDIGTEVMRYLDTGEPAARQRLGRDEADFEEFQNRYERLAHTPKHKELLEKIGALYSEYIALAHSLVDQRDALRALYPDVVSNIEGLRANIAREALLENSRAVDVPAIMANRVNDLSVWLNRYLVASDLTYKQRLFEAAGGLQAELETFQHLRLTAK